MGSSEIAFLALGLMLGAAAGAALVQVLRAGSAPRQEVRLTISPNSIQARRASTLAVAGGVRYDRPVPGSPEEDAWADVVSASPAPASGAPVPAAPSARTDRTPVPSRAPSIPVTAVAIPIGTRAGDVALRPASADAAASADPALPHPATPAAQASGIAIAVRPTQRPAADTTTATAASATAASATPVIVGAVPLRPVAVGPGRPNGDGGPTGPETGPGSASAQACADERHLVTERCALAEAARDEAKRAADALREAQRAYDLLRERVEHAQDVADPRQVSAAKERLHAAFRKANEAASGPEEAEAAAREWLNDVNRLNAAVREALRLAEAGSTELRAQQPVLERLALEADAARITAEKAEAGCRAAREDLARCEEQAEALAAASAVPAAPEEPHPFADVWPVQEPALAVHVPPPVDLIEGPPIIIRILRGDREARDRAVAALAGADPDATREWQLRLAQLGDAIVARAIEDGFLDLPEDDPFWRLFSIRETREIVTALSALGFRFDGLGGFADERVPSARDLSLAVGYAGLDPMRIRVWPRDTELASLYSMATVAADEWLAGQAGDLALGQMVDALGARAGDLAEVWNAWGRVRPVLLGA